MQSQEVQNNIAPPSIEECRQILEEEGKLMSDSQIEAFRDALWPTVEGILDDYLLHTIGSKEV
jgi:hypothetical protein